MAANRPQQPDRRSVRRSHVVWASLLASMTCVGGLLLLSEGRPGPGALPPAAGLARPDASSIRDVLDTPVAIDRDRWQGIVVHHSGFVSGSPESLARDHEQQGLRGLGHHFVIANGRGAADGEIHVGYRWSRQLPGAHALGPDADWYNRHTISVCLIGDGDQRGFSELQLRRLVQLVATLADELGIDPERVVLHRDIAPSSSPGRLFPEAAFRARLADLP